jgi:hypothetical protein
VRALVCLALVAGCASASSLPSAAPEARTAPEDADLLAVVPAEAEVVLIVDLAQLRRSPWTRQLVTEGAAARGGGQGFDEATDVDRLILVRLPDEGASLTVVQGRFQRARVEAAFREGKSDVTSSNFRGSAVWQSQLEAMAFLTPRTLLSGPLPAVRGAIDAAWGRARDVRGERWLRQIRGQSEKPAALEIAIKVSDQMRSLMHEDLAEAEALERVGGRLDLGSDLALSLIGATTTGTQAAGLAARLQETAGVLGQRPSMAALGLAPVLTGARIAARGTEVGAELNITESERDDIAARWAAAARLIAGARAKKKTP